MASTQDPFNIIESTLAAAPQPTAPVNDQAGQNTTPPVNGNGSNHQSRGVFYDAAQILIERGIPFTILRPKTKIAILHEWQLKAFRTIDEVKSSQGTINPDWNVGAIAQAVPDGIWLFEVDRPEVIERIERENGQKIPKTFRVRSQKGRGHFYWKTNTASILMGNIGQTFVKEGDWSARVNNAYCVAAKSVHPKTNEPYKVVSEAKIIEAPDWLISWCLSQKIEKDSAPTELKKNEAGLVQHGNIHPWLVRKSGEFRAAGLSVEEIETALIRFAHETCAPPLDEAKITAIARSFGKYPAPSNEPIYVDGRIPGTVVDTEVVEEGSVVENIEEKLPEFPRFSGLLSEMCDVVCPDIPYEFKMMAAVTHWGLIRSKFDSLDSDPNLQPRFYTCLIASPGMGKTAAINEIRTILSCLNPNYIITKSVDSGPALVDEFVDRAKQMMMRDSGDSESRVLLDPDEMTDLFEKSKMTAQSRNSLSTELLGLYEGNRTANRSRKAGKSQVDNAHFAILAGATPEGYERMWAGTGGGSTGLQSRFVLNSTAAGKMPIDRRPTNFEALKFYVDELIPLASRPAQVFKLNPEAKKALRDWWGVDRPKPSESRIDDMVKRLLIVLAATNDVQVVGPDLVAQAVQFGDYVIAAREKYNPSDSHSWTQAFEQAIIKIGQQHKIAMTMNDYRRMVHPNRKPGGFGSFMQAWKTLVQVGVLKADGATHKGTVKYRVTN